MSILSKVANAKAFSALQHKGFRFFWFSSVGQSFGSGLQELTIAWLVLDLTGKISQLGIVIFLQGLPMLVMLFWGGLLADRFDRAKIIQTGQAICFLILGTLAVLALTDTARVWHVYVASLVLGGVQSVTGPARASMVRQLVPDKSMMNAVMLNSSVGNLMQILGPSTAGLIIGFFGTHLALFINAAAYLVGLFFMTMVGSISPSRKSTRPTTTMARDFVDGFKYLRGTAPVLAIISMGLVMGLFIHPATQLMPAFARGELNVGPEAAGALLMMAGVGSLIGNGTLLALGDITKKHIVMIAMAFTYGFSMLAIALIPSYLGAVIFMLGIGMGRHVCVSLGTTLLQLLTPQGMLGRMTSFWQGGVALRLVGTIYMGFAGEHIGQRIAMGIGALAYIVAITLITVVNPALRRLDPQSRPVEPGAEKLKV